MYVIIYTYSSYVYVGMHVYLYVYIDVYVSIYGYILSQYILPKKRPTHTPHAHALAGAQLLGSTIFLML